MHRRTRKSSLSLLVLLLECLLVLVVSQSGLVVFVVDLMTVKDFKVVVVNKDIKLAHKFANLGAYSKSSLFTYSLAVSINQPVFCIFVKNWVAKWIYLEFT